jgi:integrase
MSPRSAAPRPLDGCHRSVPTLHHDRFRAAAPRPRPPGRTRPVRADRCSSCRAPLFTLAVVYGMRRGEISALRWEDVGFEAEHLSVRATLVRVGGQLVRGPVKTRAGVRTLPLVPLTRTRAAGAARPTGGAACGRRQQLAQHRLRLHHPHRTPRRATQQLPLVRANRRRSGPAPDRLPRPTAHRRDAAQGPRRSGT